MSAESGRAAVRDRDGATASLGPQLVELRHLLHEGDAARPAPRQPRVAVLQCPVEGARSITAHEDGRMQLLDRLGPRPDCVEVHELPMILRLLLRPDRLHRHHPILTGTVQQSELDIHEGLLYVAAILRVCPLMSTRPPTEPGDRGGTRCGRSCRTQVAGVRGLPRAALSPPVSFAISPEKTLEPRIVA